MQRKNEQRREERFYRSLYRIRRMEEEVARIYPSDKIKSPVHLSIGQEAIPVGVCEALKPKDIVFGTYRSHASYLAKGGDLKKMMAELYGKSTGCAKGKGGSMHLIDPAAGVMGTSAIVASTISQAVGYGYAQKIMKKPTAVVSFFGDGACEEGAFHESLNFASLKNVPVLFVCENNLYAVHTPLKSRQPMNNIWERIRGYGIPSLRIEDGNDVIRIFEVAQKEIAEIREGGGPRFMECMTYRWKEHVGPGEDYDSGYRLKSEAEPWIKGDAVKRLGSLLEPEKRRQIEEEVEQEIAEAVQFAEQSPFPLDKELYTELFKEVGVS